LSRCLLRDESRGRQVVIYRLEWGRSTQQFDSSINSPSMRPLVPPPPPSSPASRCIECRGWPGGSIQAQTPNLGPVGLCPSPCCSESHRVSGRGCCSCHTKDGVLTRFSWVLIRHEVLLGVLDRSEMFVTTDTSASPGSGTTGDRREWSRDASSVRGGSVDWLVTRKPVPSGRAWCFGK